MEQKNKFDAFDKPDEFDKMLFDYYDNKNEEIPLSTQKAIENAFKDKHKEKSATIIMLKRVAVFILCIGIVTATTVYAKDIINFITSIFTNSTPGIDKAVDNEFIQNVNMDFITFNDVGIKVDYLLMDDYNLDISFVYKYCGNSQNLQSIKYNNICIKDEQNNVLCLLSNTPIKDNTIEVIGTTIKSSNDQQFLDDSSVRDSILITPTNTCFPKSQKLFIEINTISLKIDDEIIEINGNWNFSINLDNKFVTRTSYEYTSKYSEDISLIKTNLSNSSLDIEIQLNIPLNNSIVLKRGSIILKDESNNQYKYDKISSGNNIDSSKEYASIINLSYPITSFDNIDKLFLHINLDLDKHLDIELRK